MWSSYFGEPTSDPRLVTVRSSDGQCATRFLGEIGAPSRMVFADGATLPDGRKGSVGVMDDGTTFFSPDGETWELLRR